MRGMVLSEKSLGACCRTSLPGLLPGSYQKQGFCICQAVKKEAGLVSMGSLQGCFERGKAIFMAKNKTEIYVSAVYDGQLDAMDVFVDLIARKYGENRDFTEESLVNARGSDYNDGKARQGLAPSGLCR